MTAVAMTTLAAGLAILIAPTAAALAIGILAGWIARRRWRLWLHSARCTYCRGRDGAAAIHLAAIERRGITLDDPE